MKRLIPYMSKYFFICLLFQTISISAQWNFSSYYSLPMPPHLISGQAQLKKVDFVNEINGMYNYSQYISPSSGNVVSLRATNDSGKTWPTGFYLMDSHIETFSIYSIRKQNTFYHLWAGAGGVLVLDKLDSLGHFAGSLPIEYCTQVLQFSAIDSSNYFYISTPVQYCDTNHVIYINKVENGIPTYRIDSFVNVIPGSLLFTDMMTGYIIPKNISGGNDNLLIKTTTGGTQWNTVFSDSTVSIIKCFFSSDSVGYLLCNPHKLIRTIDGGMNWQYINTDSNRNFNGIYFLNNDTGFLCGNYGTILKTVDGGQNWSKQNTFVNDNFLDIFFVNDSIGFSYSGYGNSTSQGIIDYPIFKSNQNNTTTVWELSNSSGNELSVFPNPVTSELNLLTPESFLYKSEMTVSIYNYNGKLLEQMNFPKSQKVLNVNASKYPTGIYFVRLSNSKGYLNKRFIKI